MKNLRNKNQPPVTGLVQEYIDSAFDVIYAVYLNLDALVALGEAVAGGDLEGMLIEDDINTLAKLNAIVTDATLLDESDIVKMPFATQGEAEGGTDNTHAMTALRVYQAIATFADTVPHNYDGEGPPTIFDDVSDGWMPGSVWIDTATLPNESYRCSDNSLNTAVWLKTTLTADELAVVALTGNSDDLTEGVTKLLLTPAERTKLAGVLSTPADIAAAYASVVPQVSSPERIAGTQTALRTYAPADVREMAALHGKGVWQETTTNIMAAKGDKWIYRGVGAHTVTLPATFTVGDSPSEIWINQNGTGSILLTPASGDNLIVSGNVLAANATHTLLPGVLAIVVPAVTNTTWIVTVVSITGGVSAVFKTVNYAAVAGDLIGVGSDTGPITITLPGSPADNAFVGIWDGDDNAGANNITIARNGSTIDGVSADFIIDVDSGRVDLIYSSAAGTWKVMVIVQAPVVLDAEVSDASFRIQDDGDPTKQIAFQASQVTAGQTRTITMSDENVEMDWFKKYKGQNNQTGTSYTLVLTDAGKILDLSNAAAIALTIPANSSVPFPIDTIIDVCQAGAGQITVGITTDTLRGNTKSNGQWKFISLWKRNTTEWVVIGGTV